MAAVLIRGKRHRTSAGILGLYRGVRIHLTRRGVREDCIEKAAGQYESRKAHNDAL